MLLCALLLLTVLPASAGFAEQTYGMGVINAEGVAFRKAASAESGRIRRLHMGTVVEVIETNVNAEWHKVRHAGKTGYVNRIYVTLQPSLDAETPCRGVVVNCEEYVNVRGTASKRGRLLGTANRGAAYTVTKPNVSGGWHEIDYNGVTGYIATEYLALSGAGSSGQLAVLQVEGGTMHPAFSPDVYGYVVEATSDRVKITAEAVDGAKVSVGSTKRSSAEISMPESGSKTVRISVGGKVRYSVYLVRNALTVGTWNIKRGNSKLAEMGTLIEAQKPDLMGIQEVYRSRQKTGAVVDNLLSLRTKHMQNISFARTVSYAGGGEYGIGLLSAYEIREEKTWPMPSGSGEQRVLQRIVVTIDGKPVSVYNTHFSYHSAAIRAQQFALVKRTMDADENAYRILFGDFNAKASEFTVFDRGYTVLNGTETKFYDYSGALMEKSEIDNIVVSDNITVLNARMIDEMHSDHLPIFAYLRLD